MKRLKNMSFFYILTAVCDEYRMRREAFSPQFPTVKLKNAVLDIERGLLEMPQKSLIFWADETIDFCLKYIEMSGMVKHRNAHRHLVSEQKRREGEHVRIQNRKSSVEICHC